MMSLRLRVLIIVIMSLVMIYIVNLTRKKKIDFKYALGWLFVDLCILFLSVFPLILNEVALFLGIASPMNMLFFFGFCFAVIMIFSLSMSVSRLSDKVRKLSQEIAIIRKDMYDNYTRLDQGKADRKNDDKDRDK